MTIEEIARLAAVSRSTVSRVLNNHPNVRPQVRERVLEIMRQQGYVPQAAARSLATRKTGVMGLIIPDSAMMVFEDPFFGPVIHTLTEAAAAHGYFLMLAMIKRDLEQGFYDRVLRSRHFDGVIVLSHDIDDVILPQLMRDRAPLVLFGSHPYFDDLAFVDADQRGGARIATQHLAQLGHKRIATITGPLRMQAAIDRRDGYKQALLESRLAIVPELIIEGDWTRQGGYRAMQQLLALPDRPTAAFIASDTMAVGAIRAINEAGLSVPREVALVSFDDLPFAAYTSPPLTTIHQPISQTGATAVKLLVQQIESGVVSHEHINLPVELVVRESCGASREAAPLQIASVA
jgi:LacI family transcriptional regulator